MSLMDSLPLCTTFLRVDYAMEALVDPASCVHCAQLGSGVLRHSVNHMESLAQASSLLKDNSVDNKVQ